MIDRVMLYIYSLLKYLYLNGLSPILSHIKLFGINSQITFGIKRINKFWDK